MAHAEHILSNLQTDAMLSLAQELIKIPSFKTEETPVARYLGEFFTARGYDVQIQEVQPGRFQTIATLKGSGGGSDSATV
jgi:acetylornithine deacetylase